MRALALALVLALAAGAARAGGHAFWRSMTGTGAGGARRVFGGHAAPRGAWGAVCALLDRYWAPRCSGAVLAPRWVLTAAHCVSPRLAYVKYNARRPAAPGGHTAPVHYLYRHPQYAVEQRDEGAGPDVTLLLHDVGLVRTRTDMRLEQPPARAPLAALAAYDPRDLAGQEVTVLGFGRTEAARQGEELFVAALVVRACERGGWRECACGVAVPGAAPAGVCAGDSGGPVLYRGAQVAVTSMGPLECAGGAPGAAATSVFTALRAYAPLVNATIFGTERALQMARVSAAPAPRAVHALLAVTLALHALSAALSPSLRSSTPPSSASSARCKWHA